MRYSSADSVAFTDAMGRTASVKLAIPSVGRSSQSFEVECSPDIALDEVATRQSAYGDGSEASAYRVFEENVVELLEVWLDAGKLRRLRVPL